MSRHRPHTQNPKRRGAFTLVELLVSMSVIVLALGVSFPFLNRMRQSTVQNQFRNEVLAAMQANIETINTYHSPDADNAAPRISGDVYAGTAVIFDKTNRLIHFANNNQMAVDTTIANPNDPNHFLENQNIGDLPGDRWAPQWTLGRTMPTDIRKKAYDLLKSMEPVRISSSLEVVGVWRDDNGTFDNPADDSLRMVPPPFAICCAPDAYGMPVAPQVYTSFQNDLGVYEPLPCSFPLVVIYTRDRVERAGANPDDLSTLPGATDEEKISFLINACNASLVELTMQNDASMDTP